MVRSDRYVQFRFALDFPQPYGRALKEGQKAQAELIAVMPRAGGNFIHADRLLEELGASS
ncbi:hypothetical protein [Mesorhizobium amorphae]|uniref:Uncharacterized protein n=1 Tax=Mesorhizobium amorphae CCNWGS0123 TaxID=1082933 RepID=G6YIY2_9HYPH|nr:hypothetical protein [Mesorhizobium amorphae]ANT54419.1 hypothetical protein A6B35_30720 [Mesorhizobium amorphae CCNWGS0123]EHH05822.1 hypothetical protein MEA186_29782 [Mesorhizobium amorphae CCNWGS0123]